LNWSLQTTSNPGFSTLKLIAQQNKTVPEKKTKISCGAFFPNYTKNKKFPDVVTLNFNTSARKSPKENLAFHEYD
jgi:hypothetical protein